MSLEHFQTAEQIIALVDNVLVDDTPRSADELAVCMANAQALALCGIVVQLERIADALDNRTRTE